MSDGGEIVSLLSSKSLPVQHQRQESLVTYGATSTSVQVVLDIEETVETRKGGLGAKELVSEDEVVCSLFQKQHCRDNSKESGFETDRAPRSRTTSFSSCEELEDLQEEAEVPGTLELFHYMEIHTKQVEQELRKISLATRGQPEGEGVLDVTSTVLAINVVENDFNAISIDTEFVSVEDERKRCTSAFGVLYNLKHEILRLKRYFDSECARLDQFVMGGESMEDAQRLLSENSLRQERFKSRLDSCMETVGQEMDSIRCKNDIIINGVRTRPNRKFSESTINKLIRKSPIDCVTWFHGFLFLALMVMIGYLYLWSRSSDQWTVCLRLVRSPLLVVLLCYLYGINMKIWAKYKVDYVTIFSHHPSSTPTPQYIFKVASTLTILMSVLVVGVLVAAPFSKVLPLKIAPLAMWLVLLAFLFNPFNVFLRKARFNLCLTFVRILLSPLVFVYFADFFLADQFNSTVAIFLDVQYLVCYLTVVPWSGEHVYPQKCTSSGNGIRPIISLLPASWRFLQCLRCYYDTRNIKHLVNAGKYFTTFPVILFATFFSTKVKGDIRLHFDLETVGWIVICLLVSSFVHSMYTFMWDVSQDWGLWNLKCTLFNRRLVYRRKFVYLLAMLIDFVFRFLWTAKLTLAIVWEKDSDLVYTGMCMCAP